MLATTDGTSFVGYWDGDLLAGKGLSIDVPRSKGLTFEHADEAHMWAERILSQNGVLVDVVDKQGNRVPPNVDHHAWDHTPCRWCGR